MSEQTFYRIWHNLLNKYEKGWKHSGIDHTYTADDLFTFELEEEPDEYYNYYDRGYKVIPKKENYTEAAKYLSNIMDIFEQNASFDS